MSIRPALAWLLSLTASALCAACAPSRMPAPRSDLSKLEFAQESQAGHAAVDITPPPGLGMFGHGPEARIAEGTLLRLRCHAFVFVGAASDGATKPEALALVPCELAAPSLLLQRRVAERVAAAGVPLGADRIWLSATHTHAAPGHYFSADSYTGPTSSRRIGFDRDVLEFLAERIARALIAAYRGLRPARWAWAKEDVFGLSKNRAYPAFVQNRQLSAKLAAQLAQPHEDVTQAAIDPQLSLLRIDQRAPEDGSFQPSAALLVFGLHPTVIDHTNALYGGDAFAYAERALASALERKHGRPVLVGLANGIEGDVTAVRTEGSVGEARRIGAALADRALSLWQREFEGADREQKLDAHARVRSAYRDLDFSRARVGRDGALCETPELGTPAGGGADDHPTFLRALEPFNPGVHARQPRQCQGPKYPIVNLGKAGAGRSFARYAPVSAAILGNGLVIALPAEVTTVTGMRIRDTVEAIAHSDEKLTVSAVLGLSNEYLEYVASADEYALQRYEGASTLYGPHSAEFLREQSACLVRYLFGAHVAQCNGQRAAINQPIVVPYELSTEIRWWRRLQRETAKHGLALSKPALIAGRDGPAWLTSSVRGLSPGDVMDPDAFGAEVRRDQQVVDDTQGPAFAVRWDDAREEWSLTWSPDAATAAELCGQSLRLRVFAKQQAAISEPVTYRCPESSEHAAP